MVSATTSFLTLIKPKEIVFDPREVKGHGPVFVGHTYNLKWSVHVDYLCAGWLKDLSTLFGVGSEIMLTLNNAVLGSIIRYGMSAWYGSLTGMKLKGKRLPMKTTYERTVVRKDLSHILLQECEI